MNVKINAYVEIADITEEAAIAAAIEKVNSFDTVNEAILGRDVVTKLYYIAPLLNKILVVVSESDRDSLGVDDVILSNTLITEYPYIKLPPVISDYTELIVRKGSFLSVEQIANAGQALIEESAAKVLPGKIPVLKVINYNNEDPSQLVLPSIFGANTFLSSDAIVVNDGDADAGLEVLESPFGILDLDYTASIELNTFQSGNSFANDQFGSTVAISADGLIAMVGAYGSDASKTDGGAVHTFKRLNLTSAWVFVNTFMPADNAFGDMFGSSVALSGNGLVAIVGAPGADDIMSNGGKIYTLQRSGIDSIWSKVNTFIPEDTAASDYFGRSAVISNDGCVAMVGSYNSEATENSSTAYTLRRADTDAAWIQVDAKNLPNITPYVYDTAVLDGETLEGNGLTDPSKTMTMVFDKISVIDDFLPSNIMHATAGGVSLKIDYSIEYAGRHVNIIIGGMAYRGTFTENEDFANPILLNALDLAPNTYFGTGLAISGDGLACMVGTYGVDVTVQNSGKVYTYKRANILDLWTYVNTLEADTANSTDYFGMGLALSGDGMTAMIGNYGDNGAGLNAGKVNTYERVDEDTVWGMINSFQADTPIAGDYFGSSIAISRYGHATLVGAPGNDTIAEGAGIVHTLQQELVV